MYGDGFGQIGHLPADTKLADVSQHMNSDSSPSESVLSAVENATGTEILLAMEITRYGRRIGCLLFRATGDDATGKLSTHGISLFTETDIQLGLGKS